MNTENIPDKYTKTAENGEFIIFKDWIDEAKTQCMVMFLSDWGANILKTHGTWLFDGTFLICPKPFSQLYVCMAAPETGGNGIPVGWFLLPNKEAKTYELMFHTLLNKLGGQPNSLKNIMSDFEQAVFKSVSKVFTRVEHKGCQFHLNQAIWRNLGEHGLQSLFHQSPSFQEIINKLYALSYVKVNDVVAVYRDHVLPNIQQGLDENVDWQDYLEELHEFGEYYESTWIERRNHRSPKYPPVLWNHHDSIMQDGIQTNNYLESYNRTLNSLAGKNANVWIMQDLFVKQDADSRRTFLSNSAGQDRSNDTGKKHKSLDKRARIQFILNGYDAMPKNDLITMLAHSI